MTTRDICERTQDGAATYSEILEEGRQRAIEAGFTGEIPMLPPCEPGESVLVPMYDRLTAEDIQRMGLGRCSWCGGGREPGGPIVHEPSCPENE
jgi:hypothetical protein